MDLELIRLVVTFGPIVFAGGVVIGYFNTLGRKRK